MYFIPGWLVALITFPGVIVHEIAHRFFCDITRVPVYGVRYFILSEEIAGCVIYHPTNSLRKLLLIACGPLVINTVLCMALTFPSAISQLVMGASSIGNRSILRHMDTIMYWVGFTIGMQAIPSNQDMKYVKTVAQSRSFLLYYPVLALVISVQGLNFLRRIWFDFIYALCISSVLPYLIFYKL